MGELLEQLQAALPQNMGPEITATMRAAFNTLQQGMQKAAAEDKAAREAKAAAEADAIAERAAAAAAAAEQARQQEAEAAAKAAAVAASNAMPIDSEGAECMLENLLDQTIGKINDALPEEQRKEQEEQREQAKKRLRTTGLKLVPPPGPN